MGSFVFPCAMQLTHQVDCYSLNDTEMSTAVESIAQMSVNKLTREDVNYIYQIASFAFSDQQSCNKSHSLIGDD